MKTTRSVAKIQRGAVIASVLMSNDILPLMVLDFVPRNEMRKVALVCRFFMTNVASHLEPVILTFICRRQFTGHYHSDYTPLLYYPKSKTWRHVATPLFSIAAEWTELNGFYYAISYENVVRYDPVDDV